MNRRPITLHVDRWTDGGRTRWRWSLVGYGDAVHGIARTRRDAVRIARRCQRTNLRYYFARIYPRGW